MSQHNQNSDIQKYSDPQAALEHAISKADVGQALAEGFKTRVRVTLTDGQQLRAIFVGKGEMTEVMAPDTGEIRELGTWVFHAVGVRNVEFELLDSAILGKQLKRFVDRAPIELIVMRAGTIRSGMRNLTRWIVAEPTTEVEDAEIVSE